MLLRLDLTVTFVCDTNDLVNGWARTDQASDADPRDPEQQPLQTLGKVIDQLTAASGRDGVAVSL